MSNVIDLADQAMFLAERSPVANLLQCVWVYDRAVDIDGLRRFHRQLQRGRLSRRIERSPLPFGRHRWVTPGDQPGIEIVSTPRPREEFDAWLGEQATTPLDSEHGPGWQLAVLPFTDGGAGVSLLISHCLTDGVGLCEALADAARGRGDAIRWPAAASRGRWRAVCEDARQTARDTRAIGRAVAAAARLGLRSRGTGPVATPPTVPARPDERITVPMAMIFVDADVWDARAHSLGGTSNALLAALAARLAQRVGRVAADGSVTLAVPINERTADDTRANAITMLDITVDPAPAATDLREIRAAIKQALVRHREVPDERQALLPLVPLLPQRLARRMVGMATGGATNVVVTSNIGAAPPAVKRPDGTDADYAAVRFLYPRLTKAMIDQIGGLLCLHSARADRQVFVSVLAYQPGCRNSNDDLQQHISSVLSEFSLTASIGWPSSAPAGADR